MGEGWGGLEGKKWLGKRRGKLASYRDQDQAQDHDQQDQAQDQDQDQRLVIREGGGRESLTK
jgi:hypothetical protein